MGILVVGGQSRNIGKTSLVVDIIRAFSGAQWTAFKITQYGHGVCAVNGEGCDCAPADHAIACDEETDRQGQTDTSRFLAAGAARALWLRTKQDYLAEGMPLFRAQARGARNVIVESNSLLQFLRPALYLVVLDPAVEDFKDSARRFLDRADALVMRSDWPAPKPAKGTENPPATAWPETLRALAAGKTSFLHLLNRPLPEDLVAWIRDRFEV